MYSHKGEGKPGRSLQGVQLTVVAAEVDHSAQNDGGGEHPETGIVAPLLLARVGVHRVEHPVMAAKIHQPIGYGG